MKFRNFLNKVEHDRVDQAIRTAEERTGARIVVYVDHRRVEDAMAESRLLFQKLRLETDHSKAGLLLFIAPKSQKFSVVGGTALHKKLGQAWWDHLAGIMGAQFRKGSYSEGLLLAIEEAGRSLHQHFPMQAESSSRPAIIEK